MAAAMGAPARIRLTDQWVLSHRPPKAALDPSRAYTTTWEEEPDASGQLASTAVVFLTNRECPFRCVMCDLWVNTLDAPVGPGVIPGQIRQALDAMPRAVQIKLYNAGSFFDPKAIPPDDDAAIADLVSGFARVIVEAHPAFLAGPYGERCLRFRDRLRGRLEVAVGLETAHPDVLARLNKRMTLDDFERAARFLRREGLDLRVFVLLNPPFLRASDALEWACRSLDLAADCGAAVCAVIPTRAGNGAVGAPGASYERPRLPALEAALEYGLTAGRMRVLADLWDVGRFFDCGCSPRRAGRLKEMNRTQRVAPPVACSCDA